MAETQSTQLHIEEPAAAGAGFACPALPSLTPKQSVEDRLVRCCALQVHLRSRRDQKGNRDMGEKNDDDP